MGELDCHCRCQGCALTPVVSVWLLDVRVLWWKGSPMGSMAVIQIPLDA